ncbi:MAG: hypothetical protein FWC50_09410 [Planctomycetaceae bacterium]|nr:hypothetical protein [Planctomycetaceae bacterium]
MTKLKTLWIDGNQNMTDAGLKHLTGLKDLEELCLQGSNKVTPEGIVYLQKALPKCKITH